MGNNLPGAGMTRFDEFPVGYSSQAAKRGPDCGEQVRWLSTISRASRALKTRELKGLRPLFAPFRSFSLRPLFASFLGFGVTGPPHPRRFDEFSAGPLGGRRSVTWIGESRFGGCPGSPLISPGADPAAPAAAPQAGPAQAGPRLAPRALRGHGEVKVTVPLTPVPLTPTFSTDTQYFTPNPEGNFAEFNRPLVFGWSFWNLRCDR